MVVSCGGLIVTTAARHGNSTPVASTGAGPDVEFLVRSSLARNTQRAYLSDLAHFEAWGGSLPSDPVQIASYLAAHRQIHSVATLQRRLASLSKAHAAGALSNPARAELVRATLCGIRRTTERARRQAEPLLVEDLRRIVSSLGNTTIDVRDAALLLIGFAGGFRRSEVVSFDWSDVEHVRRGIILNLRRSKTDQTGEGRRIAIPLGRTRLCPVATLHAWAERSGTSGPMFRSIDKGGRIGSDRLTGEAVCLVLKKRVAGAGMDASRFSGHSLRAGFATSAAEAGAAPHKIRSQTGHASDAMLNRYIREADLFRGNAAGLLL